MKPRVLVTLVAVLLGLLSAGPAAAAAWPGGVHCASLSGAFMAVVDSTSTPR